MYIFLLWDLSQVDLPRGVISGLRDALDTLKKLDAAGKVTCLKYGYDESWGTPGVDALAVFKLSQSKLDAPEI